MPFLEILILLAHVILNKQIRSILQVTLIVRQIAMWQKEMWKRYSGSLDAFHVTV